MTSETGNLMSTDRDSESRHHLPRRVRLGVLIVLTVVHSGLLAWSAYRDSFTWDEVSFLPAGIAHWQYGNFDLYRVNPPLVRMVSAIPVLFANPKLDWSDYDGSIYKRSEREIGMKLMAINGTRSFYLLSLARWACIPFSLIGLVTCYLWASELFGDVSGLLAGTLWCFEPNILGHGHLITPDVGATALGLAACYSFRKWLLTPGWKFACVSGVMLGLAELCKTSWIILFGLWPLIWIAWRSTRTHTESPYSLRGEALQLSGIVFLGLNVLNLGYGFEGTFQKLGDYRFLSRALNGEELGSKKYSARIANNRFRDSILAHLPVPVPKNYLQGIDRQKYHFERPDRSYLAGEWRDRGWYHYYLYAMYVKVPLGIWMLGYMALFLALGAVGYSARLREEFLLILPAFVMLMLVSSQTGFNRHLRYVLPIFPFVFIQISRVARSIEFHHLKILIVTGAALSWAITSSLMVYPHSLSYYNELGNGPLGGHAHLLSSNSDWGQDLLYLKKWYDSHPEARPLHLLWHVNDVDPDVAEIEALPVSSKPNPGWYAISVNRMHNTTNNFGTFLKFEPVAYAGYSIRIFHLSEADCALFSNHR